MNTSTLKRYFPPLLIFYEVGTYLSNDLYLPSMPQISRDLSATQDHVQYTLALWVLGAGTFQLILGPLGDSKGRRPVILWGALVFVISTLLCALTPSIELMWIARFIQGGTIGAMITCGYATIHALYSGKRAVQILAIMASVVILAPSLGPGLGAILLTFMSWRAIFALLALWGILCLIGLYWIMPETASEKSSIHPKQVMQDYLAILTNRQFLRFAGSMSLILAGTFAWNIEAPFILMDRYHLSELTFGVIQVLVYGPFIIGAQFTHRRIERQTVSSLIQLGMRLVMAGALAFPLFSYLMPSVAAAVGSMVWLSLGFAIMDGPLTRLAVDSCKQPLGRSVAMLSTFFNLSNAFGSLCITLFNNKTFLNLSLVMTGLVFAGILTYYSSRQAVALDDGSP